MKLKFSFPILLLAVVALAQDQTDPWKQAEIISPAKLAAELKTPDPSRYILYVGFPILYKGAHITGAKFTGPCSKQQGIDLLSAELKNTPHDAEIVIYCGCCPFGKCPNIRPAYQALKQLGYSKIKVLELDTNLHTDWVEKGYPTDQPAK